MTPSVTQIIKGIRWSFETQIAPKLEDKQCQSAARAILGLLDHLYVRVGSEGRLLSEDNQDMKDLFRKLLELLEPASEAGLGAALAEMKERVTKEYRPAGGYPTVDSLSEENVDLKRAFGRALRALQGHKAAIPAGVYARADRAIRDQLIRQLDRESIWLLPLAGKRVW